MPRLYAAAVSSGLSPQTIETASVHRYTPNATSPTRRAHRPWEVDRRRATGPDVRSAVTRSLALSGAPSVARRSAFPSSITGDDIPCLFRRVPASHTLLE